MAKLVWDATGSRFYETGVKNCVLYPQVSGAYPKGVAWNGVSSITESPSGAEANAIYADDIKYLNILSAEELGATIEAYTYPDEFAACDGSAELVAGVTLGQQTRQSFGLCYRTVYGNDESGEDYGYKLHIIYGCFATPSDKQYQSINDSPEAISFSWEINTTPVQISDITVGDKTLSFKPTASVTIDSKTVGAAKMATLEAVLYGGEDSEARLPLPNEIYTLLAA